MQNRIKEKRKKQQKAQAVDDPAKQTPAQKKIWKRLANCKAQKKARDEGRGKAYKLFDIYSGKPAPEGVSQSEQYITFSAYVRRHVDNSKKTRKGYVNAKTGEPAPGITKETHQSGEQITCYAWLVRQKYTGFSKILEAGGDLPPVPLRGRTKLQKALAVDKQKAALQPTPLTIPPRAEASHVSAKYHSPLTTSRPTIDRIDTGKRLPLPTPPDTPLNSNPEEAFDASADPVSSWISSSTDQASPLPSADLETFADDLLLTENPFAAESDTPMLASLTESDWTAQTATATGEPLPLLSEYAAEKNVEMNFDFYFSAPVTSQPAFSPFPTTPSYPDSAEASDASTHPRLDPVISVAHGSFKQDPSPKRKPNSYSFFQPKESDRVEHASRKAKTMPQKRGGAGNLE